MLLRSSAEARPKGTEGPCCCTAQRRDSTGEQEPLVAWAKGQLFQSCGPRHVLSGREEGRGPRREVAAPRMRGSGLGPPASERAERSESPSAKSKARRRLGFPAGSMHGRSSGPGLGAAPAGSWASFQLPWPPAGSALLVAAMLVSFVFLHTEVEWIEEDPEGMMDTDASLAAERAASLLGGIGARGDKRLLQKEEGDDGGTAAGHRLGMQQGHFWEEQQQEDKPSWQRALEEQRRRRLERQAQKASMWGGSSLAELAEEQGLNASGQQRGASSSAASALSASSSASSSSSSFGSGTDSLLGSTVGLFSFGGRGGGRLGGAGQGALRWRRQPRSPTTATSSATTLSSLTAAATGSAGGLGVGAGGASSGAGAAASSGAGSQSAAGDPQAAAKAAARAASTGGRIVSKDEWEKAMTKLSASIVADVTVVVTPKHWLSASLFQLQELLEKSPAGVRVLYFMSAALPEQDKQHLRALALRLPSLVLREAAPFASGYSLRNASVELVKTKYGLFIFNDVVPLHRFWLQELYGFAEQRPEGVLFLPYVWQKGRPSSIAPAAARKIKATRMASSSSASHTTPHDTPPAAAGKEARETGSSLQASGPGAGASGPASGALEAGLAGVSPAGASPPPFQYPELMVTGPHGPFALDIVFDDFSNDGKLYVQRIEDSQVTGTRDPSNLEPRESAAAVEDHCLLVRQSFLEEALVFDPRAAWTRQDLDIALTVRYYNYRSFLVPQSQVAFLHPSLGLPIPPPQPQQLAFFTKQSNDDCCSSNQVYLRQKWGVVTGQLCRGFVDSAMRHVLWGVGELAPLPQGQQLQLLLSFFSLLGMNRFAIQGLSTWKAPPRAPASKCKASAKEKDKENSCQPMPGWMRDASSDFEAMVTRAPALDEALAKLAGGGGPGGAKGPEPQLWMGRAELLLPLRVNRVEDLWRAASLREGQLFTVRRGTVKRGDKHPGRRAPELPYLMRMYLPFVLLEFEMELSAKDLGGLDGTRGAGLGGAGGGAGSSRGSGGAGGAGFGGSGAAGGAGAAAATGAGSGGGRDREGGPGSGALSKKMCFFQGMSIVIQEHCLPASAGADATSDVGVLFNPQQRPCSRSSSYFRAYMVVRHTDMDQTPLRMFEKLRKSFQRSMTVEEGEDGGWMEGRKMIPWLTACFGSVVKRMRMIRCVPGTSDSCTVKIPLGPAPQHWRLALWAWRPQSVRTAQVLLLQPGASRIVI